MTIFYNFLINILIIYFFSHNLGFFKIHNVYNWVFDSFGFIFVKIIKLYNILLINNSTKILGLEFINSQIYDAIWHTTQTKFDFIIVILVALTLIGILFLQATLLNKSLYPNSTFDSEKYSPYECGFAPFKTEWSQFDIKFYLVALLFLVFDVELMFLLPYCLSYYYLGLTGYSVFMIFFGILLIGFLVEWATGMLVWKGEKVLTNFEEKIFWLKFPTFLKVNKVTSTMYINSYLEQTDSKYFLKRYWRHILWYNNKRLNRIMYRAPYISVGYIDKVGGYQNGDWVECYLYLNKDI